MESILFRGLYLHNTQLNSQKPERLKNEKDFTYTGNDPAIDVFSTGTGFAKNANPR